MRKLLSLLISSLLAATTLVAISSPQALAAPTLTTCTNLETGKTLVLRSTEAECRSHLGSALWVQEQSDTASRTGDGYATITICSSKNPFSTYRFIKDSCPYFQVSTTYWRTVAPPATPVVQAASARGHDSAALFITPATTAASAPVLYYLVTDTKSGLTSKVMPRNSGHLYLSGLSAESTYSFTIAAVSVDGTSLPSSITPVITTTAVPVVVVAPAAAPLAAPAFTLTSSSETKTVNNAITGYTVTSTGGAIASYSISPAAPAGLTFSNSTGLLSGTPTSVASATSYTITATNSTGSASQIFTLTTTLNLIGTTGPGGGTVFYASDAGFRCGNLFSETGSAIGGLCHYLEVAPSGWSGSVSDPYGNWSGETTTSTGLTGQAIGQGFANTEAMIQQVGGGNKTGTAGVVARGYSTLVSGTTFLDWYLPSQLELLELYKYKAAGSISGFASDQYWSSSERNDRWAYWVNFNAGGNSHKFKYYQGYVRPIRAF